MYALVKACLSFNTYLVVFSLGKKIHIILNFDKSGQGQEQWWGVSASG